MSMNLSQARSLSGRHVRSGRWSHRGTRFLGHASRALVLVALALVSVDAAAQVGWDPHRYSQEGLELNGIEPVVLPGLRVTLGVDYSFGDRIAITVPGMADHPAEGQPPFGTCNDGSFISSGAISTNVSFRCWAPLLPPNTSSTGASASRPSIFRPRSRLAERTAGRTGFPVTTTRFGRFRCFADPS